MKTTRLTLIALFLIAVSVPALASETTISLGGTAWYFWWKPAWADNKWTCPYIYDSEAGVWGEDAHDFKPASGAMAGPIITIGFLDRWSISTITVLGETRFSSRGLGFGIDYLWDAQGITRKEYSRTVLKWDSDTTLGCAVHRYFKVYAGFKAQGYRYRETIHFYDLISFPQVFITHSEQTDSVNCYGPGLGVGATIPLVENLYLLAGVSGVFLWCYEKADVSMSKSYAFDDLGLTLSYYLLPRGKYIAYGGTASLSLAYTIQRINTTLALGGRYQILFNRQREGNAFSNNVTMNMIDRQYDHFAGVTLSVIYTFHTGKKKEPAGEQGRVTRQPAGYRV